MKDLELISSELRVFVNCSMWFWLADASTATPTSTGFKWPRDSIYGAVILLGAGGAFVNVISMTLVAYMVGPYVVSV